MSNPSNPWSQTPLHFGVLFSSTGVTSSVERTQLYATQLAIETINAAGGIGGRPIIPICYDGGSDPKQYRTQAEKLLKDDGVRIIFGCYMSSTRKSILPLVEAYDAILLYPTFYEGFEYSPNCIYTGAVPNQNSLPLVRYMLENYGSRFFLVGSNYVFPYASNRILSDLIIEGGGQVVDEMFVPLSPSASDIDRLIERIARHKPDAVFSTVVGAGIAQFYEAYRRAGFDGRRNPIASLTTSEAEVAEMTPAAAEGHLTAAPYFESLDSEVNRVFVDAYRRRFGPGAPLTASAEAAYYQVHLAARAIEAAESLNPQAIARHLAKQEFEAPQGKVSVDGDNNHTLLWPRVAQIDANRRFRIVWDPHVRMKPDPYFVSAALDDWSPEMRLVRAG